MSFRASASILVRSRIAKSLGHSEDPGSTMKDKRLEEALRHLHPPPGTKLWHGGATVLGTLRGLPPQVAAWKPFPDRHSIWELALHIAYWNYAVRRRITGGAKGGFPRSPANWPHVPREWTSEAWEKDRRLVKECHYFLVDALERFDKDRLDDQAAGEGQTT